MILLQLKVPKDSVIGEKKQVVEVKEIIRTVCYLFTTNRKIFWSEEICLLGVKFTR